MHAYSCRDPHQSHFAKIAAQRGCRSSSGRIFYDAADRERIARMKHSICLTPHQLDGGDRFAFHPGLQCIEIAIQPVQPLEAIHRQNQVPCVRLSGNGGSRPSSRRVMGSPFLDRHGYGMPQSLAKNLICQIVAQIVAVVARDLQQADAGSLFDLLDESASIEGDGGNQLSIRVKKRLDDGLKPF